VKIDMKCTICEKILTVEPIFDIVDGEERLVDFDRPLICPCGNGKFVFSIKVDPSKWSGVIGTNG